MAFCAQGRCHRPKRSAEAGSVAGGSSCGEKEDEEKTSRDLRYGDLTPALAEAENEDADRPEGGSRQLEREGRDDWVLKRQGVHNGQAFRRLTAFRHCEGL